MEINLSENNKWGCSVMFSTMFLFALSVKNCKQFPQCILCESFCGLVLASSICYFSVCDISAPSMKVHRISIPTQQSDHLKCRFSPLCLL